MASPTTLPATFVSGAVLTAAQLNDLRGAFRVLQVVTFSTTTPGSSSTTTMNNTTLTATITPSSTSSRVLVFANHPSCSKSSGNTQNSIRIELVKDVGGAGFNSLAVLMTNGGFTNTSLINYFGVAGLYIDSPASVAALTYKTMFGNAVAAANVNVQVSSIRSLMVLMEIST